MIKNDAELKRAMKSLGGLRVAIEKRTCEMKEQRVPDEVIEIALAANRSLMTQTAAEIEHYCALKSGGRVGSFSVSKIGEKLIELRIKNGLSQADLARGLDVSEASISKDERSGYANIGLIKLARILAVIGEDIECVPIKENVFT